MLVSKPLYQRSLWGRTSRELRGGDLEDLFLQAHAFFSHFQLLLFSLCDIPAGAVAPADQPVSPLTAWYLRTLGPYKNRESHCSSGWDSAFRKVTAAWKVTRLLPSAGGVQSNKNLKMPQLKLHSHNTGEYANYLLLLFNQKCRRIIKAKAEPHAMLNMFTKLQQQNKF